jgi:hypothetical protein
VAIEQLQAELTACRKEEQAIRDEAQRVRAALAGGQVARGRCCAPGRLQCAWAAVTRVGLHASITCAPPGRHPLLPRPPASTKPRTRSPARATPAPRQICDDQAAELRRAEEQLQAMEAALMSRNHAVAGLQARVSELEAEAESARQEQRTFSSMFAAKEREQGRRLEAADDEVRRGWRGSREQLGTGLRRAGAHRARRWAPPASWALGQSSWCRRLPHPAGPVAQVEHQKEKVAELERLLKERSAALGAEKDRVRVPGSGGAARRSPSPDRAACAGWGHRKAWQRGGKKAVERMAATCAPMLRGEPEAAHHNKPCPAAWPPRRRWHCSRSATTWTAAAGSARGA